MNIELESVKCDLCSSNNNTLLLQARDYRYGHPEMFNIVKCNNCGLIYINPRPTIEAISKFYEEDYTPEDNLKVLPSLETSRWKISLKKVWHRINGQYIDEIITRAKGKVLDVGCGDGYLLLPLKQKGCEVFGVEINRKSVKICRRMGLEVFCGTLEDAKFLDDFFDTVIMSQVLEHLPSPKVSLREIFRILKLGGKVFIYCPNVESYLSDFFGKYWHGWHIPFHFHGFTEETIRKFGEKIGFKIKNINAITPDNFFIVSLKSYFWGNRNSGKRPIDKGKILDSLIFRMCISFILRLLDMFLEGDCLKVELVKES